MEELIASKYEDILNKRRALCMKILTSEKDLEDMLKETISMRRKLEKIKEDYTLKKRKIFDITNPTTQNFPPVVSEYCFNHYWVELCNCKRFHFI